MCGVLLGTAQEAFRRSRSLRDLTDYPEGLPPAALKSIKSFGDLAAAVDLAAELSGLHLESHRSGSQHGSEDTTARGSPTSSYEQLLRSRSPCAVLYSPADESPQQPLAAPAPVPPRQLPPLPLGMGSASPPRCGKPPLLLPADDTPFLESAASFSVVEVQAAAALARSSSLYLGGETLEHTSSLFVQQARRSDSTANSQAVAAAAAAAAETIDEDPIAAAAATQSAFAVAAAVAVAASESLFGASGSPTSVSTSSVFTSGQNAAVSAGAAASTPSPFARRPLQQQQHPSVIPHLTTMHQPIPLPGTAGSSAASSPTSSAAASMQRSLGSALGGSSSDLARRGSVDNSSWGTSCHLTEGHAAEELFYRLNHARQTVEFVKRQATTFGQLSKVGALDVWESLELLNTLREYETALLGDGQSEQGTTPDMPLLEHALQCAEACRAAFPDEDYMHLAGLLAPLGKLLAHAKWGAEPQWAICGETYPVGCRFHPAVRHSQYFSANPDRRKRLYSSPTGVYREGCGLGGVLMSWGAGEYLHLVLRLNRVALPPEALFCIRHQKLRCVFRPGMPYSELLSEFDRVQLPRLAKFQTLCAFRRQPRAEPLLVPVPGQAAASEGGEVPHQVAPALRAYYDGLIAKYVPQGVLCW